MKELQAFVENLRKRKRAFVRLALVLVVNAVVYGAVTHRLANKQERLARDQQELSTELDARSDELDQLSGAAAQVTENQSAVDEFWTDTVQPRVPGLTEAWEEIDRLTRETNVTKGRIGYDRDLLDVGLEQIRATMPVEGNYFDLVRFINRLERSAFFFLIEEVQLSQRETENTSTLRLDCSISFYLKAAPDGVSVASRGGSP